MSTIIEVLLLSTKEGKAKSGKDYKLTEAHCVIRKEDMSAAGVGVMVIPKALDGTIKPGLYSCSFALETPTYGDEAGHVVPAIVAMTPLPPGAVRRAAAPAGTPALGS